MKRFMMFSISCLCLAVAVLIGFYVGSQQVEAGTSGQFTSLVLSNGKFYGLTSDEEMFGDDADTHDAMGMDDIGNK